MKTFDGYKKQALTDVYALLAGGGHKPLSEFSMAHTHPYLPLSGGTMLGSIKFNSNSLPQKTLSYVCGIDAFADGGEMGWMRGSDFVTQYAPTKTGIGASGTWSISITGNAASATNADKVDGYHASSLWRSDGATWNPGANVSLNASGNNQEWSFDIRRNGYTGCYWHVWDSALSTLLKVNADNGKVYAPYNFVGNLEGKASTAGNADTVDGVHLDWSRNYTEGNYLAIWDNDGKHIRPIPKGSASVGYANSAGNADTVDGAHLSDIKNWSDRTTSAYWKAGWYKVASAQTGTNTEAFLTLDVNAAQSNGHATLFIRKRADSKPYFICIHNNNLNLADFRLYYNGMSMVLYARVPNDWNGKVFRIISEGREGVYDHIWTLYSNMSSTDPNAISAEGENPYINPIYSGRVDWSNSSDKATRLQTSRTLWGQSFDGTGNVDGTLTITNSGSDDPHIIATESKWFHIVSKNKLVLYAGDYNSSQRDAINILSNHNVGIGIDPTYKLHVAGDIYTTTGFKKNGSSDSYVLLGGGGHKLISDFAIYGHNHDDRYIRKWYGVYGIANKFLKISISDEKGWIRLEVSDSNNGLNGGYGIYIVGWGWHGNDNIDNLDVKCLYSNDTRYIAALKIVRTSRNNYDFYFLFAGDASYPSYTINYSSSVSSIDCTVTAIDTIPTATWTSSLSALQLNASQVDWSGIINKPSSFTPSVHTHDDRYIKKIGDMPTNAFDLIITPTNLGGEHIIDPGGGIHVKAHTGIPFQLWLHDTSNVWYKKTGNGAWIKMDAGHADIASSATKLATPRKIWGLSFDGTSDVNGLLTHIISSDDLFLSVRDNRTSSGFLAIRYYRNGTDVAAIHWFHDKFGGHAWNSNCLNLDPYKGGYVTLGCWNNPDLTVVRGGNIGIGTTSPSMKLHVNGNGIYLNSTATCGINMYSSHNESSISYKSNGGIRTVLGTYINRTFLWNESIGEHVSILSSNGYFGIGTVSPSSKLTVNGVGDDKLPVQLINASRDSTWVYNASFLAPNLTNNHNNAIFIGKAHSARNAFGLTHMNIGDGSSSNYAALEVWGVGNVLRWYYDRHSAFLHRADFSSLGSDASYMNSALLIREHGYGGAQADTWANAPRMSWHWEGRVQTQIGLGSNNELYLSKNNFGNAYKLVYETGTWGINISGNAASATKSEYSRSLLGRSTSGNDYDTNSANLVFAEWNTMSDNRWYLKATGYECRVAYANNAGNASRVYGYVGDTGSHELVRCDMNNDQFRIIAGSNGNNNGWAEIATADDGNEPIYVRQYSGVFNSVVRTLTLLDANGYSHFPSYISIGGNENNNYSPDRVWGSNGSDSYLRSYRTSALSVNYANSAGSASSATIATKLASSGYANNALSYYQTDQAFDGSATGWAHYIIANHGDGSSYYHYTIRLPFLSVPQYRRLTGNTSNVTSWYNFITAENIGSQSVNYATSAGNADTLDGLHANAFATASHSHPYLPLSGGTMTGLIVGNNKGGSWILGRSNAVIYQPRTTTDDWHPVVGFKTKTGSWEFGNVGNDDFATFSWESDSNYSSGANTNTRVNLRNSSGTIALTSDIPTKSSWNYDDRYYTRTESDNRFVNVTGDTMSGTLFALTIQGVNNSNRLIYRHLDGQNCDGNYDLYLQYHQTSSVIYLNGSTYKIYNSGANYNGNAATATNADKLDGYHASSFATSWHTHTLSLATDTGSSSIALTHGGKYKLTAGGSSIIFTLPTSNSVDPTNYYWANINISDTSSTSTAPRFSKVMINTTTSTYQLNVGGDSYITGWCRAVSGLTCTGYGVYFTHNNSVTSAGEIDMTSTNEFCWGSSDGTLHFNYRKVSRGTTVTKYIWNAGSSTAYASHTMGEIKATSITASGNIYAAHFYENSDIRYKRILRNLLINSNTIAALPLFDFEWIENNTVGTGTSAQAVQQILPNLVSGTDKLTLDYGVLGTIAGITACKELVTLKSELLQLKEKVKLLEDKLRKYENI